MKSDEKSGYIEVHHTGDIAIRVWSDTITGLFEQAFLGMTTLMDNVYGEGITWQTEFHPRGNDVADMLISFLNEILYNCEVGIGIKSIQVNELPNKRYLTILNCRKLADYHAKIKAVTYSGINLMKTVDGYSVTLVFDV